MMTFDSPEYERWAVLRNQLYRVRDRLVWAQGGSSPADGVDFAPWQAAFRFMWPTVDEPRDIGSFTVRHTREAVPCE